MTTESHPLPSPSGAIRDFGGWIAHGLPAAAVSVVRNHRSARILIAVCTAVFAALAVVAVTSESVLLSVDTVVQDAVISSRSGVLDTTMVALTELGTRYSIGILTFALVLWSAVSGRGRPFVAVVVIAVLLNPVFEISFKELVGRVRPDSAQLVPGNGPSFPSGHVVATVGFYGLMPLLAFHHARSAMTRWAALVASLAIIAAVAISRVYLDVHWTTDVIAGLILGTVLVALTYRVYLAVERRLAIEAGAPSPLPSPVSPPAALDIAA